MSRLVTEVMKAGGCADPTVPLSVARGAGSGSKLASASRAASLLGLMVLLLSGCVWSTGYSSPPPPEYVWAHPSATQAQFQSDLAFCNAQAARAVPSLPPPPMASYPPPPISEQLLENNRRMAEATRIRLMREDQRNLCMQSLGYYRVRQN